MSVVVLSVTKCQLPVTSLLTGRRVSSMKTRYVRFLTSVALTRVVVLPSSSLANHDSRALSVARLSLFRCKRTL